MDALEEQMNSFDVFLEKNECELVKMHEHKNKGKTSAQALGMVHKHSK